MPANDDMPEGFRPDDPTAADQAESDFARFTFSAKEGRPVGTWKIQLEPYDESLKVLRPGNAFLMLHLRDDVDQRTAQELAQQLSSLVHGISCTKFTT